MSIYTKVDAGVKRYRTMLPSRDRWCGTVDFFRLYGAQTRFLIPGDIWKESVSCFIRLNPMLTPSLTPMSAKIRWFYVPLRLVEPDLTELIITGSSNGKLSEEALPTFPSLPSAWEPARRYDQDPEITVQLDSIAHVIFQMPIINSTNYQLNNKCYPRLYWLKAYCRVWWDYYRDENLEVSLETSVDVTYDGETDMKASYRVDGSDFDSFFEFVSKYSWCLRCLPTCLPKDYFTSSLPWQLKGVAPTISFEVSEGLNWNNLTNPNDLVIKSDTYQTEASINIGGGSSFLSSFVGSNAPSKTDAERLAYFNKNMQKLLDKISFEASSAFNASDMRDMFAQTRVFERLARTGSRYVEYLRANFGVAPSDGTLQRAQYLGGFSQDILTTEVLQTGVGETPVGTMRGHGISSATNSMRPFLNREFGMLFTMFEVRPRVQYTQGIDRQLTYSSRYEFFNPSFQNLSEQEVRNGEIFCAGDDDIDSKDDETFGFTGMYNELRSGRERMFGSFLPNKSQAQWTQAISFPSRPNLNGSFINGTNYASSWLRPFGLSAESESTKPIIVDLYNVNTPLRPMIRNATPGLVDHA